ncbi:MAG: MFS transporter [Chloroflexota bacterium]|nr:MFS transporter [Chloroflexota bacterium]
MNSGRSFRLAYVTLAVLSSVNLINFLDRQVIAALAPTIKDYWHLTDAQVGLLGTAFEVLYALAPVPIAILSDRWLRRKVITLAIVVWSGAMAISGAAVSYWMLLFGRAALGLGEAGYAPSAMAWLSDVFPSTYRSRVVGLHDLGVMLGSAAGYALGGALGRALGWRPVFYIAALPGFILAVMVWLLPEPAKGQSDYQALGAESKTAHTPAISATTAVKQLLSVPTLLVVYVAGTLVSFAIGGLTYWLPSFAVRTHGFSENEAGFLIGAVTVLTGAAGVLSGGFLADRLIRHTPSGRLLTIGASFVAGVPLALIAISVPGQTLFIVLAALAMCLFAFYSPCMGPLVHQVTHPSLRATATAFYLFIIHILGYATGPAVVGWFSDQTGDLWWGMAVALLVALVGGLVGLWGARFVERDAQRMITRL